MRHTWQHYLRDLLLSIISASPPRPSGKFEKLEAKDWSEGLPLLELLNRVNRVAAKMRPEGAAPDARVSPTFSERSFRRYQTLGGIDPPERPGRQCVYGFRHFVQGLLVRRLLREGMPSWWITALMAGRGTDELRQLLLGEYEVVARHSGGEAALAAPGEAEVWKRIAVASGIELHLRSDLPRSKPGELKKLLELLERAFEEERLI